MKLIYNATTKSGKLHIFRRKEFLEDVLRVFPDKDLVISVEKKTRKRSLNQNNFYWGVVVPLVREGLFDVGYRFTIEETHDHLKREFLKKEKVNYQTGEILQTTGSTQELTTSEFMDFIAEIQQWSVEYLNTEIPDPGEQLNFEI